MHEQFMELTNQIFGDGYARRLAEENPTGFQYQFTEFLNTYPNDEGQNFLTGESHHEDQAQKYS